jgi:hypothetical protein
MSKARHKRNAIWRRHRVRSRSPSGGSRLRKGALQYRLKPANLANEAWTSVRSKSELAADEAVGLAKGHPGAIGGVIAAATLFLAREPLWRTLTGMFGRGAPSFRGRRHRHGPARHRR